MIEYASQTTKAALARNTRLLQGNLQPSCFISVHTKNPNMNTMVQKIVAATIIAGDSNADENDK